MVSDAVSTDDGNMPAAGRVSDDGDLGQAVEEHGEPDRQDPDRAGQSLPGGDVRRERSSLRGVRLIGKTGTFGHGMTELACRLLSLHLRRDTPLEEIIEQCRGIKDMTPTPNVQDDGTVVWNTGVGDAIAQVLQEFVSHSGSDD